VGPPRGGPLKKFSRLAIARHGVPPINMFVIPTLGIAHSFNCTPAFVDMRLVDAFLFFPTEIDEFPRTKIISTVYLKRTIAVDAIAVIKLKTSFRQYSGIFSVSYNFGVARSDSLVIDVSSCCFSVGFISDSNF